MVNLLFRLMNKEKGKNIRNESNKLHFKNSKST